MTDLEMTELCAQAIGWRYSFGEYHSSGTQFVRKLWPYEKDNIYDPLDDDDQAMALVKKMRLRIDESILAKEPTWFVAPQSGPLVGRVKAFNTDLNRAIVECVAKMQNASPTPQHGGDS